VSSTSAAPPGPRPPVTRETAHAHNLTDFEYERILALLGRVPTIEELGIFSALWSEHSSYKHSRPVLRLLPTEGPAVLQGPGENAGVLRLPHGWAVAFKIESHNHPTAVEPYQGAATGVGGILRDVFTMGARPVALLNSLRFGLLDHARSRYLLAGAVKGIGDYGNCVGVPTLGGEVDFGRSYAGNPLVNAMCVGILREEQLMRAAATGPGNVLMTMGARTGRDGIHGASFASEVLTEQSESRRPQVQVADPFTEKLLLEATLELIASGHVVGVQDMGAAGITSSSAEMAARGGSGVDIDLARVPTREPDMTPYEILLSESQERMLVVARAGHEDAVCAIAATWDLDATPIGVVTDDGMFRARWGDEVVAEIPGARLVSDCPVYTPAAREDEGLVARRAARPSDGAPHDWAAALEAVLDAPSVASKRWIYEQYDSTVRGATAIGPGGDAGVFGIPGETFGIAVAVDCNARWVGLDPYEGGKAAVAEAARNVACVGARPLGITNCLNFGSPERPEVYHQFREAVRGMADACVTLDTPVTGGNVSFYNESPAGSVAPTPVIGMIGLLDDVTDRVPCHAQAPRDIVLVLGEPGAGALGGSVFWETVYGHRDGRPPSIDLAAEQRLVRLLPLLAAAGLVRSAHDVSAGGLAVALAEVAMGDVYAGSGFGLEADVTGLGPDPAGVLFGEDGGRVVVTLAAQHMAAVVEQAGRHGVPAHRIGTVLEADGPFRVVHGAIRIERAVARLREIYTEAIPRRMAIIEA